MSKTGRTAAKTGTFNPAGETQKRKTPISIKGLAKRLETMNEAQRNVFYLKVINSLTELSQNIQKDVSQIINLCSTDEYVDVYVNKEDREAVDYLAAKHLVLSSYLMSPEINKRILKLVLLEINSPIEG